MPTDNDHARFTIKLNPHSIRHVDIYVFVDIILKPKYPESLPYFSTKKCSAIDNIRGILKEARNLLKIETNKSIFDSLEFIRDCLDKHADKIDEESKTQLKTISNDEKSQMPLSIDETNTLSIQERFPTTNVVKV